MINWTVYDQQISEHFTVKEAIWLPSWNRLATASDGLEARVEAALVTFITGPLEAIRSWLGRALNVHVMYRPIAYNQQIGGALHSAHQCLGDWAACDFDVGEDCDQTRQRILDAGLLDSFGLRMENKPGSGWVHLDNHPVLNSRYFIP